MILNDAASLDDLRVTARKPAGSSVTLPVVADAYIFSLVVRREYHSETDTVTQTKRPSFPYMTSMDLLMFRVLNGWRWWVC